MTTNKVVKILGCNPICVKKYKGQFRYHKSYYWGILDTPDKLISLIKKKLPTATITNSGNHYHGFVGGAESGSTKDSFLWATFTV